MLNRDQLQELGRFKLLMRRACQESVQIERFLTDRSYQSKMLDLAEDQDDDELLLMLAVTLRARLGRLGEGEEAFEQICPPMQPVFDPTLAATEALPTVAQEEVAAATAPTQAVAAAVLASADPIPSDPTVVVERQAVRSRSVLSGLFSTSANRAPTTAVNEPPATRYVHSLR
ncbi:MAG: hypothetical protein VXW65_04070 [Pseudomonadota bacterium]|nr:hypothetical protein [Pseudomonadota bacterium]